jgi:spore maturation protein CgeB
MKILFTGSEYDRYDISRGHSFEYNNFYGALKKMHGVEVTYASFQDILTLGKQGFAEKLIAQVEREKPNFVFVFMYTDELSPETIRRIREKTTVLGWFSDDQWRFNNYSRHYATSFSWVATTYSKAPERYYALGQKNVIRSMWFCDASSYVPVDCVKDTEVSFVGLKNDGRAELATQICAAGLPLTLYGGGWDGGRLPQAEFTRLFSRSKINLNIISPRSLWERNSFGRLFARRSLDRFVPDFHLFDNVRSWLGQRILQIKGRPFEIAACGGFCISGYADDFENYYKENEEMVFYRNSDDLIEKIYYYLARPEERERIAKAGYERTLREHTAEKRFSAMFTAMGL